MRRQSQQSQQSSAMEEEEEYEEEDTFQVSFKFCPNRVFTRCTSGLLPIEISHMRSSLDEHDEAGTLHVLGFQVHRQRFHTSHATKSFAKQTNFSAALAHASSNDEAIIRRRVR